MVSLQFSDSKSLIEFIEGLMEKRQVGTQSAVQCTASTQTTNQIVSVPIPEGIKVDWETKAVSVPCGWSYVENTLTHVAKGEKWIINWENKSICKQN